MENWKVLFSKFVRETDLEIEEIKEDFSLISYNTYKAYQGDLNVLLKRHEREQQEGKFNSVLNEVF